MRPVGPEQRYRDAWKSYLMAKTNDERDALGKLMDELQPQIADGPKDQRWIEFKKTLPGFESFWRGLGKRMLKRLGAGI